MLSYTLKLYPVRLRLLGGWGWGVKMYRFSRNVFIHFTDYILHYTVFSNWPDLSCVSLGLGDCMLCVTHKVKLDECLCDQLTHREANITVMSVTLNAAPEPNIMNDDQTQTNTYTQQQVKYISSSKGLLSWVFRDTSRYEHVVFFSQVDTTMSFHSELNQGWIDSHCITTCPFPRITTGYHALSWQVDTMLYW